MKNKLIEKAKKIKSRTKLEYSKQEIELAIAWMKRDVSGKGVMIALGKGNQGRGSLYNFLAISLRKACDGGLIK